MPVGEFKSPKRLVIRYKGLFDFEGLYTLVVQWFKYRGFWFHERTYKHKVPSPKGAEDEIEWDGMKKISEYVAHAINVYIHLWDMTEVKVVKDGVEKTLTNARMEIVIRAIMTLDYQKKWERGAFWNALGDFYEKYIIKKEFETIQWDQVWYRAHKLHAIIKDFMDMQAKGYEYKGYLGEG